MIRPSSMRYRVIGFSSDTSLPALMAAMAIGACQWSGVEIMTVSMSLRAINSRKSWKAAQPA